MDREIDVYSLEWDGRGVDMFICYAEWDDGTPLTEDELNSIESEDVSFLYYAQKYGWGGYVDQDGE